MTQTEILAQFEQMTPRQQQALLQRLQKAAQKSTRIAHPDDKSSALSVLGALNRRNQAQDEPELLTDEEKRILRAQIRQELSEGAYAPLEETDDQRRRRLAAIPPAEAMTGVIHWKNGETPSDEELKEFYIKHLIRKYS